MQYADSTADEKALTSFAQDPEYQQASTEVAKIAMSAGLLRWSAWRTQASSNCRQCERRAQWRTCSAVAGYDHGTASVGCARASPSTLAAVAGPVTANGHPRLRKEWPKSKCTVALHRGTMKEFREVVWAMEEARRMAGVAMEGLIEVVAEKLRLAK